MIWKQLSKRGITLKMGKLEKLDVAICYNIYTYATVSCVYPRAAAHVFPRPLQCMLGKFHLLNNDVGGNYEIRAERALGFAIDRSVVTQVRNSTQEKKPSVMVKKPF